MNNYLFKPKYSNITGANDLVDMTTLNRLLSELNILQTVDLPTAEQALSTSNLNLDYNIGQVAAGLMDPRNVDVERNKRDSAQAVVNKIRNVKIPEKERQVKAEQDRVNRQLELQIEILREKAKTDPNALAALKELESQKAKLSGKRTWLVIGGIVIVVIIIIAGYIIVKRKLKK